MLCGDRKSVSKYSVGKQILLVCGETLNIWPLHAVFTVIPWKVNPIDRCSRRSSLFMHWLSVWLRHRFLKTLWVFCQEVIVCLNCASVISLYGLNSFLRRCFYLYSACCLIWLQFDLEHAAGRCLCWLKGALPGTFGTEAAQNSENVKITNTFLRFFSVLCRASSFISSSFVPLHCGLVGSHNILPKNILRGFEGTVPSSCLPNAPLAICLFN